MPISVSSASAGDIFRRSLSKFDRMTIYFSTFLGHARVAATEIFHAFVELRLTK